MIMPWVAVPLLFLAAVTVPLAVTDVRTLRLPDAIVVPGLVLLAWALVGAGVGGAGLAGAADAVGGLGGAGLAGAALGLGWVGGAVGMGDVKLGVVLGGLAGMTGAAARPDALALGCVVAAAMGAMQLAGALADGVPLAGARIPFGPALLGGFWAAVAATGL